MAFNILAFAVLVVAYFAYDWWVMRPSRAPSPAQHRRPRLALVVAHRGGGATGRDPAERRLRAVGNSVLDGRRTASSSSVTPPIGRLGSTGAFLRTSGQSRPRSHT